MALSRDSFWSEGSWVLLGPACWPCPALGFHRDISEGYAQKPSLAFEALPPLKWSSHPKRSLVLCLPRGRKWAHKSQEEFQPLKSDSGQVAMAPFALSGLKLPTALVGS